MMWFGGYKESRKSPFIGHYYLTGDTAELHADGSMSFVGRSDDVITTSGYRIDLSMWKAHYLNTTL